jgi:hypothetical protein
VHGELDTITLTHGGDNYTSAPTVVFTSSSGYGAAATATIDNGQVVDITITNPGTGYQIAPVISFIGGGGTSAAAVATIHANIDKADSFGDNNTFREQGKTVMNFDESNPFGDII